MIRQMMSRSQGCLAIAAMVLGSYVVGGATPASADPTGTTFSFTTTNFQGDGGDPAVPFGIPTSIPGSEVTVESMVSVSPAIPGLTLGNLDFIDFWITTNNSEFLNGDIGANGIWTISGLNWGPGEPPAFGTGFIFLSFDIDGNFVDLTPALGIPIVPHPITMQDTIPVDIMGDDVSFIEFNPDDLVGVTLATILATFGVPLGDISRVDSMHVGFEVTHIPEPASLGLLGCGLAALVAMRRRKR